MEPEKKIYDVQAIVDEMEELRHDFALIEKAHEIHNLYGKYISALTVAIMEGIFIGITFISAIAN